MSEAATEDGGKPLLCGHEGRDAESERKHAIVCATYQRILSQRYPGDDEHCDWRAPGRSIVSGH